MLNARRIIQATGVVTAITLAYQALGFGEKLLLAYYFGMGIEVDAYLLAFSIPFFSFIVLSETVEPALLPTFLSLGEETWRLVRTLGTVLFSGLMLVVGLALLLAQPLAALVAPGFWGEGRSLLVELVRLAVPALVLLGLSTLTTTALHAQKRFALPAMGIFVFRLGPLLLFYLWGGVKGLALGIVMGALGKLALEWGGLRRPDIFRPSLELSYPPLRKVGRLAAPLFLGFVLSLLVAPLVDSAFASTLGAGRVSALIFAKKIVETITTTLPLSLGVVLLPFSSEMALGDKREELRAILRGSVRGIVLIFAPFTVALLLLAVPVTRLLFERGQFDATSTGLTATALIYYSWGLIPFSLEVVLARFYYAFSDTLTPVILEFLAFGLNILLILALIGSLSLGGIGLAASLAKGFKVALMFILLRRKVGSLGLREYLPFLGRVGLATLAMGLAMGGAREGLGSPIAPLGFLGQMGYLSLTLAAGGVSFLASLFLLRLEEVRAWPALWSRPSGSRPNQ